MRMNDVLAKWNEASEDAAVADLLPCNGSSLWAQCLTQQRPFLHVEHLLQAADATWWALSEHAWQEAFDSHPRIGERHATAATRTSLQWSAGEQSAVSAEEAVKIALAEANRRYEDRFGRIFLVCATGKSAAEILACLQRRLSHDEAAELREAAEQQRRITQLRLRKWLGLPAARCEDV